MFLDKVKKPYCKAKFYLAYNRGHVLGNMQIPFHQTHYVLLKKAKEELERAKRIERGGMRNLRRNAKKNSDHNARKPHRLLANKTDSRQ